MPLCEAALYLCDKLNSKSTTKASFKWHMASAPEIPGLTLSSTQRNSCTYIAFESWDFEKSWNLLRVSLSLVPAATRPDLPMPALTIL